MALCMSSGNDAYIRRAFAARSPFRNFGFNESSDTPPTLRTAWAQLGDRFTVVVGGTETNAQVFRYALTHYLGTQTLLNCGWCNATFAQYTVATGNFIKPAWEANNRDPVLLVGHSMGGAIVPMLIYQLYARGVSQFDRVVTLGSPRAITASMSQKLAPAQHLRFVLDGDPIQHLPPPQSIVRAFGPGIVAGGYPGGDYFGLSPRLQINYGAGLEELPAYGLPELEWTSAFANYLLSGGDPSLHFARSYVNAAKAYHTGGGGYATSPLDWVDFRSLFTLDDDLAAIGL